MTPEQQKARELVEKFYSQISGMELTYISKMVQFPNGDSHFETAKQCALIACDEILNVDAVKCRIGLTSFWQSVKQEITKL